VSEPSQQWTDKDVTLAAIDIEMAFLKGEGPSWTTRATHYSAKFGKTDHVLAGMANLCGILLKHIATSEKVDPMDVLDRTYHAVKNQE
jgi:hypothetical protein